MAESSDSAEVQNFMAAFQKRRNLVDDTPDLIVSEARDSKSVRNLCDAIFDAECKLRRMERSRRELFASPTNPAFIRAWRNYNLDYSGPVYEVVQPDLPQWEDLFGDDPPDSSRSLVIDSSALEEFLGWYPPKP